MSHRAPGRIPLFAAPLLLLLALDPSPEGTDRPRIHWNDNEDPAGQLEDGRLEIDLELGRGDWHPLGEEEAALRKLAFAEVGGRLLAPGPLIRVPEGTEVRATVTNPLDVPVDVQGLAARHDPDLERGRLPPGADLPRVRVSPGETELFRFTADERGTYFYRARVPDEATAGDEEGYVGDGLLAGALIVDAPDEGPREHEKVMVIQVGEQAGTGYLTINGRPWPLTERLTYDLGDEVTYRVINDTGIAHPMHLHGFFFTLHSRGDIAHQTVYGPPRQRKKVTQTVRPGGTFRLSWSPTRPGGWIFHCHIGFDFMPNPDVSGTSPEFPEWIRRNAREIPEGNMHARPEKGMGGMVMGIYVRPPDGWTPAEPEGEPRRIHVRKDSTPGHALPRFGYAVGEPGEPPPAGEVPFPGQPLVLHEGSAAPVRVVNETDEPTTVHWHGLEVESLYDGVAGVTGYRQYRSPAVMPGDSFDVTLRTDRPGTYIYHTHMTDIRQQGAGLYAPLVILPEGEEWEPETDRIYIVGDGFGEVESLEGLRLFTSKFLNGSTDPEPAEMTVGTTYRLRLINIALGGEMLFRLARDGYPVEWRPLAEDAWDLPAHQRERTAARKKLNVGETYDVTFTPREPGELTFQVRLADFEPIEQRIRVTEADEESP